MVTLSVTRSRVAAVLRDAAGLLEQVGWDPERTSLMGAIDQAAGFVPGCGTVDEEAATLEAWDALVTHLGTPLVVRWEHAPGRTQAEVLAALRAAADAVSGAVR